MQNILQVAIDAMENLPTGSTATLLKYQKDILHPATELLKDMKRNLPENKGLAMARQFVSNFVDATEHHMKMIESLGRIFGADVYHVGHEEILEDVQVAKDFVSKIDNILIKEEVEDICASDSET
jgi:hypothetical protein